MNADFKKRSFQRNDSFHKAQSGTVKRKKMIVNRRRTSALFESRSQIIKRRAKLEKMFNRVLKCPCIKSAVKRVKSFLITSLRIKFKLFFFHIDFNATQITGKIRN